MEGMRALVSNKGTICWQHNKNSDGKNEDDDDDDVDEKDDDGDQDDDVTRAAMQSGAEQWRWLRRTISNLDGSMFAIGTPTSYNQVLSIPILFNAPIFFSATNETKTSSFWQGSRKTQGLFQMEQFSFSVPTFDQGDKKN